MDLQCLVLGRDYCTRVALPFLLSPEMLLADRDWGMRGTDGFILQVKFLVGKFPPGITESKLRALLSRALQLISQ